MTDSTRPRALVGMCLLINVPMAVGNTFMAHQYALAGFSGALAVVCFLFLWYLARQHVEEP